jgi:hypothetical protein
MTHDLAFRYVLPVGFGPRVVPTPVERATPFGRYRVRWVEEPGAVRVETFLSLGVDQVAAADYPAFRAFLQGFDKAIRAPLVIGRVP